MLRTILSITGKPGLYKLVSQGNRLLIVEDLASGKRLPVHPRDKVVSLGDISMYTVGDDRKLSDILTAVYEGTKGEQIDIKALGGNDGIRARFAEFVPDYDEERVYPSDMRKLFSWYNILRAAGFDDFSENEPEAPAGEEKAEEQA